jgi:DNA-directed RNA polymerase specialized sigma24 family protein
MIDDDLRRLNEGALDYSAEMRVANQDTVGGLSQEAAAAVLRTTTKAVEMRLRRARQKLSEALNLSAEG